MGNKMWSVSTPVMAPEELVWITVYTAVISTDRPLPAGREGLAKEHADRAAITFMERFRPSELKEARERLAAEGE
jgi:hypothetical protein